MHQDKNGNKLGINDLVKDSLGATGSIVEFHETEHGIAVSVSGSSFKHLVSKVEKLQS